MKSLAFEFYQTLSRLTNNTGLNVPNVRAFSVYIGVLLSYSLGSIPLIHPYGPRMAPSQNGHKIRARSRPLWNCGNEGEWLCRFVSSVPSP